jgi:hypothetical protein
MQSFGGKPLGRPKKEGGGGNIRLRLRETGW